VTIAMVAACMPALRLAPGLEARPRRELRLRAGSDGDFDFGAFRVRHVRRGLVTSISAGATSSLGANVTGGVSLFSSWQPIGFTLEGRPARQHWSFRCERYRDEDRRFAGLACDVGPEDSPAYRVEVDPSGGRVLGIGNDTALDVTTQRAFSGSILGAHVFAAEGPVAAVRLQPDMALVLAADAAPAARLGSAVLAAALFVADDYPP
jgi:hypothetical protein